jgi:hypothetical protein
MRGCQRFDFFALFFFRALTVFFVFFFAAFLADFFGASFFAVFLEVFFTLLLEVGFLAYFGAAAFTAAAFLRFAFLATATGWVSAAACPAISSAVIGSASRFSSTGGLAVSTRLETANGFCICSVTEDATSFTLSAMELTVALTRLVTLSAMLGFSGVTGGTSLSSSMASSRIDQEG